MFVHSLPTHTLEKKIRQELNRNRPMGENTADACTSLQPTVGQTSFVLPFALGHFFSSSLIDSLNTLFEALTLLCNGNLQLGKCLIPVLVTSCSPGSPDIFLLLCLLLSGCIFLASLLILSCLPRCSPLCPLFTVYELYRVCACTHSVVSSLC